MIAVDVLPVPDLPTTIRLDEVFIISSSYCVNLIGKLGILFINSKIF